MFEVFWGFKFSESLVWVRMSDDNRPIESDSPYFRKSKLCLLIFKKFLAHVRPELRHQRSSDVIFKRDLDGQLPHTEIYEIVEKMIPSTEWYSKHEHGPFLHLWADKITLRKGWTMVCMTPKP